MTDLIHNLAGVALWWAGITLALWALVFLLFLAVMKLREMRREDTFKDLHWSGQAVGWVIAVIGYIGDALLNYIGLSVMFLEAPDFIGEPLCTQRVIRHKYHSTGWRRERALWCCSKWLSPVDKTHCDG